MTDSRAGSADKGSNTAGNDDAARFPSLDGNTRLTERRMKILALLTEEPLWKAKVGEWFVESVQTIGRDVDALQADGLVEPVFLSPAETVRHHLVGFATTEAGEATLEDYLICERCGDVVDTRQDCVHAYVPVSAIVDTDGGDR